MDGDNRWNFPRCYIPSGNHRLPHRGTDRGTDRGIAKAAVHTQRCGRPLMMLEYRSRA